MFKKILIANRGEIACRVIKTAQRMGIKTVAVYSDADRDALHMEMADEAVHIGGSASAQSYLRIEAIIAACQQTGAEAVHPGYGFLSENRRFQEALAAAGIVFIGPDAHAIEAMGDKITSKKLAAAAGVTTVPGYMGIIKDTDEAVKIACEIGYPVMIKASAGGGGKGMRVAWNDAEARDGFERSTSEARSSFGDDRVFIEKFVDQPRHIEIQILSDGETCLYLNERECSIQRRHQKVIEEAPSPFLDAATRQAMGEQAVALSKAVQYKSAGTVEFIVDGQRNFYFLEMNTRLQVEHPVTEKITGLDLVEWMIRIAAGEKLDFAQSDVRIDGWAMESRVYAEDPYRGFLPSTGRLIHYQPPVESDHVRVDTGVSAGGEISMFYDPMIAKLITYGATRHEAIAHMRRALDEFYIRGVSHNIPFLASMLGKQRFVDGRLTTGFIAEEYPDGFHAAAQSGQDLTTVVCVAAVVNHLAVERDATLSGQMAGHGRKVGKDYEVKVSHGDYRAVTVNAIKASNGATVWQVTLAGQVHTLASRWTHGDSLWAGTVNDTPVVVQIDRQGTGSRLFHQGAVVNVQVFEPHVAALDRLMLVKVPPDLSRFVLSPMPGLLVSLAVVVGQKVKAGETVAIVEAMKMENVLRAEADATVLKVCAVAGDSLTVDQVIVEFAGGEAVA